MLQIRIIANQFSTLIIIAQILTKVYFSKTGIAVNVCQCIVKKNPHKTLNI